MPWRHKQTSIKTKPVGSLEHTHTPAIGTRHMIPFLELRSQIFASLVGLAVVLGTAVPHASAQESGIQGASAEASVSPSEPAATVESQAQPTAEQDDTPSNLESKTAETTPATPDTTHESENKSQAEGESATSPQPSEAETTPEPLVAEAAASEPALSEAQQSSFDACQQQAAPQQYGGPAFNDLQLDLAMTACNQAWQQVPSKVALISAYIGRTLEAQGQTEAAYWLYKRATADGLPVGYGLMAYRLMRLGEDDAKAAAVAETGHALGDWNASNVLATLYAQQRIEGKGPGEALALIEYVAEQGSPFAQYLTAWLYETHASDMQAALGWYERAVSNGEDAAAAFLADLLERGVAQQAAAPQGQASPSEAGSQPQPPMSPADIAEASPADLERAAALYWQALERGDSWAEQQFTQRGKERTAAVLIDIQRRLADAGYSVGAPDGVFGRKTESAVRALVAKAVKR